MSDSLWPQRLYVAYQAPLSMGFSRQECWSGLPFPSPEDLPDPGTEPGSPGFLSSFQRIHTTDTEITEPILISKASLCLYSRFLFQCLHLRFVLFSKISSSWVPSLTVKLFSLRSFHNLSLSSPRFSVRRSPTLVPPFRDLSVYQTCSYAMGRPESPIYIKFKIVKTLLLYFNT